jgi:hypothetical protein
VHFVFNKNKFFIKTFNACSYEQIYNKCFIIMALNRTIFLHSNNLIIKTEYKNNEYQLIHKKMIKNKEIEFTKNQISEYIKLFTCSKQTL